MLEYLLNNATALGTGPVANPSDRLQERDEVIIQVELTGTATMRVLGRLTPDMPWVEMFSTSTGGLFPVARVPFLQAEVTAYTSGAVNAVCHG